jgi:glycosyltransferase involved in cell wall biosynthesis
VEFLGRQDHDRVPELLAEAHLVALTSYGFDNQPMTVVEAATAARGVLYCDPALSEGLVGPGIQVPPAEAELSAALVELVEHPDRVVTASRATEGARAEFAPQTHARRMLALYEAAVRRARAARTAEPESSPASADAAGRS